MSDCLFCKIVAGTIPSKTVYEDELCLAFHDINPQAPIHVVIVPRKHIATLNDVTLNDRVIAGNLMFAAANIAKTLGFDEAGYRVALNTNKDAGQTVFHIHLHVLAGRQLSWPPG
jgi:histidine triad (HIT) family protein